MTSNSSTPSVNVGDEELAANPEEVARTILLAELARRPRSRWELGEKLRVRHVPADIAAQLLDRFEEVGLINDREFARMWVDSRARTKNLASSLLRQELRAKRVADEVLDEVFSELDAAAEVSRARELVRTKLRRQGTVSRPQAQQKLTRRLVSHLARKGYPPGMAFSIVREEMGAVTAGVGEDSGYDDADW